MRELLLNSLEIENFRAFRHLQIERLGRVNLIVGKNNIGKTSLLEALYLYARQASFVAIWDVLEARGEGTRPPFERASSVEAINDQVTAIAQLFYGRIVLDHAPAAIRIGNILNVPATLTLDVSWQHATEAGIGEHAGPRIMNGLLVRRGKGAQVAYTFDQTALWLREPPQGWPCQYVTTTGLPPDQISSLWNATTLTDRETDVIVALQLIEPAVERVNLLTERAYPAVVKLTDTAEPVRLRSLGEGMNRLFTIILALVNAKNGLLLIDEIENGLHYAIQPRVWQIIFHIAQRLNVQLFATTHSWDCIEAFQIAADEHPEEGQIIKLGRKGNDIIASHFAEQAMAIITRDHIEVR
ncbi:AAA family ATPase [Candidatus Viridilinea mediisalina]|uniref:AAA+ ATPase domain-containing protein n=1 Tax=Candidatus Viridilinea mediisalina TaxID=2024553 RepID=A0A2A6RHD0_9CHLR|nr:ATP-binding protein [Candidatus Viridilinea mediisalina]PDW02351.1 hypothetical protein CJ255_14460 [Candidatus Viridilinea mediisalina]